MVWRGILQYLGDTLSYYAYHILGGALILIIHQIGRKLIARSLFKVKESQMLEGKEVEGKIGTVGSYSVDIAGDIANIGKVAADAQVAFTKDVLPAIPGALNVEFDGKFILKADPVALAIMELKKSTSAVAVFLANELASLRAGADPHPAVAAAVATPTP